MKKFLKKANRGLILGAVALILLVIYIIVDYSGFNEEKPKIKEAVENYIGEFYERLSDDDYEGICKLVNEAWESEPVLVTSYHDDKESLSQFFKSEKNETQKALYGDISHTIDKLTVSKSGPDMAKVTVNYTATIEYDSSGDIMSPCCSYSQGWYGFEDEESARYIYVYSYETEIYLRKVDGEWKLVQSDEWSTDCTAYKKEDE